MHSGDCDDSDWSTLCSYCKGYPVDKWDQLVADCPLFLMNEDENAPTPYGQRGFEVGDGWFDLIASTSKAIETILEAQAPEDRAGIRCAQVKEKFGVLRWYVDGLDLDVGGPHWHDNIERLIAQAESDSRKICEKCGQPGRIRGRNWLVTRCDACTS